MLAILTLGAAGAALGLYLLVARCAQALPGSNDDFIFF